MAYLKHFFHRQDQVALMVKLRYHIQYFQFWISAKVLMCFCHGKEKSLYGISSPYTQLLDLIMFSNDDNNNN